MLEYLKDDIQMRREMNRMSVDTYSMHYNNILDRPLNKLIAKLEADFEGEIEKHDRLQELAKNDPNKFNGLDEIAQQTGHSMNIQMMDHIQTANFIQEEIAALEEIKIIYAFKHFEINLKKLISATYPNSNIQKNYKWEDLIKFLKSKNIEAKNLTDYNEIHQLKQVNNSLKHSGDLGSFSHIPEFQQNKMELVKLSEFYKRVKNSPQKFISALSREIYKERYDFDNYRLQTMAESIAERMDKEVAIKFIDKIKMLY